MVDHLSDPRDGGFFRYAAAADWSGAHTEKVSVDQGRIARLLIEAGCALAERDYLTSASRAIAHARSRLADADGHVYSSVAADAEYYAGRRDDEPPAVDQRRFADASASICAAAWLHAAVTGEPVAFRSEYGEASSAGAVPHRLDERQGLVGLLADQSAAIEAALMEYRATGDPSVLDWARRAADWSLEQLWNDDAGAFRSLPASAADDCFDLPPMFPLLANGEMASALASLSAHLGDVSYRRTVERVVESLGAESVASPAGTGIALAAQRLEHAPAQADLWGDPADPRARDLARAALAAMGPSAVVRWKGGAGPRLVLCSGDLCLPPAETARDLLESVAGLDPAAGGILLPYFSA